MKSFMIKHKPKVLVLNRSYMPISVQPWDIVMGDWYTGRADIVHSYSDEKYRIHGGINSSGYSSSVMCPSVIIYPDAPVEAGNMVRTKPLTRKTLYDEYNGVCCYCGIKMKFSEYTREHIHPTSDNGLDVWANVAPCCSPCNSKKDDKPLKDSGMVLQYKINVPVMDKRVPKNLLIEIGGVVPHETWVQYIYWNRTENFEKEV